MPNKFFDAYPTYQGLQLLNAMAILADQNVWRSQQHISSKLGLGMGPNQPSLRPTGAGHEGVEADGVGPR